MNNPFDKLTTWEQVEDNMMSDFDNLKCSQCKYKCDCEEVGVFDKIDPYDKPAEENCFELSDEAIEEEIERLSEPPEYW